MPEMQKRKRKLAGYC